MTKTINISKITGKSKATTIPINSITSLSSFITSNDWSPNSFKNKRRNKSNFKSTNLMVLDIDDGCTIKEAKSKFKDYRYIIGTTKSHQINKNGLVCDRFRVILYLDTPITDSQIYNSTWNSLYKAYPFIDSRCRDTSRYYYRCNQIISTNSTGKLISPASLPVDVTQNIKGTTSIDKNSNTIVYSGGRTYGASYILPMIVELGPILNPRKYTIESLAVFLASNITRLRRKNCIINQEYMAEKLGIKRRTASDILKKLVKYEYLEPQNGGEYTKGYESKVYGLSPKFSKVLGIGKKPKKKSTRYRKNIEPKDKWKDGMANSQMIGHIGWGKVNGYSDAQTLKLCKKMQGNREAEKMRSDEDILYAIKWYRKDKSPFVYK